MALGAIGFRGMSCERSQNPIEKPVLPERATVSTKLIRVERGEVLVRPDRLTVEEPLEMAAKFQGKTYPLGITLRTPGHDEQLLRGFLFSEGIVQRAEQILDIKLSVEEETTLPATRIVVSLADDAQLDPEASKRLFPISASCGACGKSALAALKISRSGAFELGKKKISEEGLHRLPAALKEVQSVFEQTGGIHASALFNYNGELLAVAEDVGRHNSLDKLVGQSSMENQLPWENCILFLSGRVGYDLMQKAVMAGCPFVVSVGAPSSLAVEIATLFKITLVGFLKMDKFNVYSASERLEL